METILALICVASLIAFVVGMIKPKLFIPDKLQIKNKRWAIFGICVVLFFSCAIWGGTISDNNTSKQFQKDKVGIHNKKTQTNYEIGIDAFFNGEYKDAKKYLNKGKFCDTCFYNTQAILSIIEWRTTENKEKYISKQLSKKWYCLLSVIDSTDPTASIDRYSTEYTNRGDKVYSEEYVKDGRLIEFLCDDRNTGGISYNYRYIVDGTTTSVILPYATEKYIVEYISDNVMITKSEAWNTRNYFINPDNKVTAEQELLTISRISISDIDSRLSQISNLINAQKYIEANNGIMECRKRAAFRSAVDMTFNSNEVDSLFIEMQKAIMPKTEAEYVTLYDSLSKPLLSELKSSHYKRESLELLSKVVRDCEDVTAKFNAMGYKVPKLKQFNKSLESLFSKENKDYELYGDDDIESVKYWAESNAKTILKNIARDPSSVKIDKVVCDGKLKNGWKCRVQYRAKNGYGGYGRDVITLVMQYDVSDKVYKCIAYTI